jgi:OFA family oxalate/formate antiporter-like MFS transporter
MAVWGLIQGAVVLLAALMIVKPPKSWVPPGWDKKEDELNKLHHLHTSHLDCTPLQMLKTPSFYLIYVMMTIVAFGGLVVTAQLSPIAKFYKVDTVTIAFGMSALVLAIEVDRILNGLTRPFWGWVSDHIGRENTMFVAFAMEALAVFALLQLIHKPVWFILLSGLTFFAWGEIFSLFPAITGDLFGKTWATTNYGIVYTAKGLASIFAGPVAAMVSVKAGNWVPIFYAMIACDLVAALLALLVLKPVAERTIDRNEKLRAEALAAVTVEKSRPVKGVA